MDAINISYCLNCAHFTVTNTVRITSLRYSHMKGLRNSNLTSMGVK